MAETIKSPIQSAPGATTRTKVYTVPAATQAVISTIAVCNRGGTATTFRVSLAVADAADDSKQYVAYDYPIRANRLVQLTLGITLGAGDCIYVYAGNANLTFNVFMVENA